MTVHFPTPDALTLAVPYHHVAVGIGSRHVHVAGQVASRADGTLVGHGDLAAQVAQAVRNTRAGLAAAGATYADVVRLTFYVVDWEPEMMAPFIAGITEVADEVGLPTPLPPASLIGVSRLFEPGVLVELEATAIVE